MRIILLVLLGSLLLVSLALNACSLNQAGRISSSRKGDLALGEAPWGSYNARTVQACGTAGGPTAAAEGHILRRPYLQRLTAEGAWLLWTARGTEPARVQITTPQGQTVTEVEAEIDARARLPQGRQWVARVEGLQPSTTYCYEIAAGGQVVQARTGFTTSPPRGSDAPIRFITMGDLGERSADQFAVLEQLQKVEFDFALINGDVAYSDGTLSELERNFFSVYADVLQSVPFFAASGNHDYRTDDAGPFRQSFAAFPNGGEHGIDRWYSFDWGSAHIVVLDTERIGADQAAWLEEDLAANDLPWVIVIGHRPPYSSGSHGSDQNMRRHFVPLFEKYGVDVYFAGHDHHYERTHAINGVDYLISGAGGKGTRNIRKSDFTVFAEPVSHFIYVTIEPGQMNLWAIDGRGAVFDTHAIRPETVAERAAR